MEDRIRILLLENVAEDAEMNIRELKNEGLDFEAQLTTGKDEFEKALTEFRPDIILADYRLPNFTGLDALRIVRERRVTAPVIIVTGALDEETAVDTIKEGAVDYVVKQHIVRLGPSVRSALEKQRLAEDKERAQQALREAYRDLEEKVERRTAELAASERRLREVLDHIPDAVVLYNRELRIDYVNSAAERLTGRSAADFIGKRDEEVWPPEVAGQWKSASKGALETGEVRALETAVTLSDKNDLRFLQVICVPIRDEQGKTREVVGITHDLTDRKRAEDVLRRNEYELRTLVNNSPDLIFRLNRRMQYVYTNPAYERVTGIPREQFAGKTNSELGMPPGMVEFWKSSFGRALASGRELSIEFDMTSFFGKRYFFARLIPEFAKSGLVETVLVIARDITERKKAEEQIRYISFHDEVTGLFNRAFFEEELHRVDTERSLPVSIIMGDVNNLKLMNDVFGHDEGDALLKAVAGSIRKACRQSDIIARWGGDEFAVILPKTDLVTADAVRARIKQIAREGRGAVIQPSVALGVAAKEKEDQNIYQAIRQAEEGMYRNKLDESRAVEQDVYDSLFRRGCERSRDFETHIDRSYALADAFGTALNLSESQRDDLRLLVKLHDIGDAVIPQEILQKPGRLDRQEWEIMKKHAEAGFRFVKNFVDTARISDEVLSHGERWDGTGYPRGLKEKEIPYLARVFSVIDAFDVMTHTRPYAGAFTREEAVEELRRNAGGQFDPELVDAFVEKCILEASAVSEV